MLAGLDPEQRAAVTAPAGPVCILAGAGTGKTRAITHRIAYRVLTGEIAARHVLAVTFTARAAAEMRARLAALGVAGVQARTFHAAALRQLRYFAPRLLRRPGACPSWWRARPGWSRLAAARAGVRTDRTAARDLAGEIEWAKSSLVEPGEYAVAAAKARRETPHEPAKVAEVFAAYEQVKRANGRDRLRGPAAGRGLGRSRSTPTSPSRSARSTGTSSSTSTRTSTRCSSGCCEAWLGGRDDLTVVGDASQTIYSFTGATSSYLVDFPRRHRDATVVRLVRDYRSTPQVVGLANAVIRQARGTEARLRLELVGQRPPGPEPELRIFPDEPAEAAAVAAPLPELIAAGTPAQRDRRAVPHQRAVRGVRGGAGRGRACRTWCRAPSGSSSGPRCARRWSRCAPPPARSPGETPLRAGRRRGAGRGRLGARTRPRPAAPPGSGGRRWPRWSGSPRSTRHARGAADRRGRRGRAPGRSPTSARSWPAGPPSSTRRRWTGVTLA